ncbi:MAG: energy transducer TonB [Methylococcaceae bacterium]|nr:energy transducer TonB [Methylococcaceae bacterium]
MSSLFAKLAAYSPQQIARLAGIFSFVLHFGIWHGLQAAVKNSEPESLTQRIEVTLMADAPKPIPPDTLTKPVLPAVVETEDVQPVAIPLPVADPMPVAKPLVKPKRKTSKPQDVEKIKPPSLKREKPPSTTTVPEIINETGPGGSAGGYGVASQTGQGIAGSIGMGGGVGGGSGGGKGPGNAPGTGSGSGDAEAISEADFKANYATNPKPKYPEEAKNLGWEGNVLLRVRVSADGHSEQVTVHRSSGHKVLDDSAVAAVQKWRFIPARRGNTAVACTVIVPIVFALN